MSDGRRSARGQSCRDLVNKASDKNGEYYNAWRLQRSELVRSLRCCAEVYGHLFREVATLASNLVVELKREGGLGKS